MAPTTVRSQNCTSFNWDTLADIPDNIGFAGSFAGISNNALIVAGGANFPDGGAPWTGSKKVWHNDIFVLDNPESEWKKVGKLPEPVGYGVSLTCQDGIILVGGSTKEKHTSKVLLLQYDGSTIKFKNLPDLPKPLANSAGVILNNIIYILGGTLDHSSKHTENNFWSLDLHNLSAGWKVLEPWKGPSRMLSVAGVQDGAIYLFSGTRLKEGVREYLKDAYKYTQKTGWQKIADLPNPTVAAPTPAFSGLNNNLYIFGGDDGSLIGIDPQKDKHPGFSKVVLSYNTNNNNWSKVGNQPGYAAVTTSLVVWNGEAIIPGGEIRPAIRTVAVVVAKPIEP